MKLSEYLSEKRASQSALAEFLGVTQSAVSQWIERGIVPAEHCPRIEKHFNGEIRCEDLNNKVDWAYLRAASQPIEQSETLPYATPNDAKARESKGGSRQPADPKKELT